MRLFKSFCLILICTGIILPAYAFWSKPKARYRIQPNFETKIIKFGKENNPPKISIVLPSDWESQNEVENDSAYDVQFYPPGQNQNWATDMIRLQVLKFHVENDQKSLAAAAEMIKRRMLVDNSSTEFLSTVEYLQAGLNTVEILSSSIAPGSKNHRAINLTKLIATDHLAHNTYGLISLNKLSLQIYSDEDYKQALLDVELYRNEFRRLKLLDWPKWASDQDLETKIVSLTNEPDSPKISIDAPKAWRVSEIVQNDDLYSFTIAPDIELGKSLRYDNITVTVSKGPMFGGYETLEGHVVDITKKELEKAQPGAKYSDPHRYLQNGMKTIEYSSDWTSPLNVRLLCLYKDIDTGSKLGNDLGLVSIRRVVSVFNLGDILKIKEELESYREPLRNIKLINWPEDSEYLKPSFEPKTIDIGSNGKKLVVNLPSDWQLERQEQTANGYSFIYQPIKNIKSIAETLEVYVEKSGNLFDKEALYASYAAHRDIAVKSGKQVSDSSFYETDDGIKTLEYDEIDDSLEHVRVYSTNKMISTGTQLDNDSGLVMILKHSSVLKGYDHKEVEDNLSLFKTELRNIKVIDWANGPEITDLPFETKVIELDNTDAKLSLPMPQNWELEKITETERYININFGPKQNILAKTNALRVSILKMPYVDTYEKLYGYRDSLIKVTSEGMPGTKFSEAHEFRQAGMRTLEFNSEYKEGNGANLFNYHKIIATGFSPSNHMGLINIAVRTSYLKDYDETPIFGDLEEWQKQLRSLRLIDWQNNKSRDKLDFKTMVINVLKERNGAKIAIPIPDTWELKSRDESDKSIKFGFEPKNPDSLVGEFILLVVRKDYFKNDSETIVSIENGIKEKLKETYPSIKFSDRAEYMEADNHMIEYTSSYLTEDGKSKIVLLDKLITTGSESNNNLGLIIISKVFSTLKEMDLRTLEQEIDLYRQQIRKIKLLKWDLES